MVAAVVSATACLPPANQRHPTDSTTTTTAPAVVARTETTSGKTWVSAHKPAGSEYIWVHLSSVTVSKAKLLQKITGERTESDRPYLVVRLKIENLSDKKKGSYRTWDQDFTLAGDVAYLSDDIGNHYKRVGFGIGTEIEGRTKEDSIYPGKSVTDVLVFELPVPKAKYLELELPGENCGVKGTFRFRIDPAQIVGHAPKK